LPVRSPLLALALVLAACGPADRGSADSARETSAAASAVVHGTDNLVMRIPRNGGEVRVFAYPRLDTIVWNGAEAPAPARILAFDEEQGVISLVDSRGQPARIDFRQGAGSTVTKSKLTGIASNDGSTIYGITADGVVERFATSGTWKWKPPVAARAVFPQPDASLLVLGERGGASIVWKVRPPSTKIADSIVLPRVDRALRTQVGDLLFLATEKELTGVRTRSMQRTASVAFDEPVELLAATPSGDRVFVVTSTGTSVQIVDRYRESVSGAIDLGRHPSDLRMDPLGRYLLARLDGVDSAAVIALGTNAVVGTLATGWRADLPFVAPDGGIALAQGQDVIVTDGTTLRPTARVSGGAADFWYPFRWTGFRPRDSRLDRPVELVIRECEGLPRGTKFSELEDIAGALGDEIARQLIESNVQEQTADWPEEDSTPCPECRGPTSKAPDRPRSLMTTRGEVTWTEHARYCHRCRRTFFPSGPGTGP